MITKAMLEKENATLRRRIAKLETAMNSQASQDHFASIFRASPSQMALTDTTTGKYVEVNQAFLQSLGFARNEIIGKTALELGLFVNTAQRAELLQRMATQGYLRDEYVLVRAKSGEVRYGLFSAEYVHVNRKKLLLTVMNDLTEKLRAEERWQFALEGAGDGVWDWDTQTNRVFFSRQWKSMLGYAEDEIGDSLDEWSSRVHPDDLAATLDKVNEHLAGKTPTYRSEYRIRCNDGTYKWILDAGKVIEWTEDKKPLRVIGTPKDITQRKQAEEKLRRNEEQYHSLVDVLDISLCRWLPDTTLTYANEKYIKIFGVQGDATGLKWLNFLPEETRASTAAFYDNVTHNPHTVTYEHSVTVDDGITREFQWIDTPILDEHGHVLEFQSIGIDITERKNAEHVLAQSQAQLSDLLNATPDAMVIVNATGKIIMANAMSETMFGYSQSELVGLLVETLIPSSMHHRHIENRVRYMEEPRAVTAGVDRDILARRKNGDEFPVEVSLNYHQIVGGERVVLCTVRDVIERKHAHDVISAQRDLARIIGTVTTNREAWSRCLEIALHVSGMDSGGLYLLDEDERVLNLVHHQGLGNDFVQMISRYPIDSPNAQRILDGKIFCLTAEQLQSQEYQHQEGVIALAVVPIQTRGRVVGCINIGSHTSTKISDLVLNTLETIATEIANIITHQRTEQDLQSSREQLSQALSAARMGTWRYSIPTNRIEWSPEAARIFGATFLQDDFATTLSHFHPEDRARLAMALQEAIVQKKLLSIEYRIFDADGNMLWITNYGHVEYDADGKPLAIIGLIQDITQRKQAEQALADSEELYRLTLSNISDAVFITDLTGAFTFVCPNVHILFGYSQSEVQEMQHISRLLGKLVFDLADLERLGEIANIEHTIVDKSGRAHALLVTVKKIAIKGGTILYSCHDISERKQAEQSLKHSEEFLKESQRIANMGSWRFDLRANKVHWSENCYNLYGFEPYEIDPSFELFKRALHPDDLPIVEEAFADLLRNPQPANQELRILDKNGHMKWIYNSMTPVVENGQVIQFSGIQIDITKRKQAEELLRASEAKYRSLIDSQDSAISTIDADGVFHYINGYGAAPFGTPQFVVGKKLHELFPPQIADWQLAQVRQVIATSQGVAHEYKSLIAGKPSWRRVSIQPIHNADGNITLATVNSLDITDRKMAEEKIRASEEKYRGLMESLDNVVATVDYEGRFLYVNDKGAGTLGGKPQDFIGKGMKEIFPEPLASFQLAGIQRIFSEDRAAVFEGQSMGDMGLNWYRFSFQPLHDENGKVVQVLINATDINALKVAQSELQELNRTLEERVKERTAQVQDLYDNAPVGYHSLDAEGKFVAINQTELNWLGYEREELLGMPIVSIYTPPMAETFYENFAQFKVTGKTSNQESVAVRKDGTTFPIVINATAIYDEKGQYVSSRSTMTDITKRKQAEDALRLTNAELERAMRVKDEFLAGMSHELRTPLNAILGLSESMIEQYIGPLNEDQLISMQTIESSGRHLLDLINEVLDLSKLEANQVLLEQGPVNAQSLCEASLMFVKDAARKKYIQLTSHMDPAVDYIKADERRLKQMLVNLLNNAVKFTPEGGAVQLQVVGNPENHTVSFSVNDTGIGIAPENLTRLFQPFVQLDSGLNRQYQGTGLGLALVARMARLHGGDVSVESKLGQGSRFSVVLPWNNLAPLELSFPDTSHKPAETESPAFISAGVLAPLVLIAEDNEETIVMMSKYLQARGYRIAIARNGNEALEYARLKQPSVILMDLQMPVLDGLEAMRRLRREADSHVANIPVIALTAFAMPADRQRSLEAGANEYVSKPVNLRQLVELINRYVMEI